ncbi:MAG: hypothetical protein QG608_2589 [Actinomycetota bacterium]|nr:hypothetical protein [Actinomycetota bacterium]
MITPVTGDQNSGPAPERAYEGRSRFAHVPGPFLATARVGLRAYGTITSPLRAEPDFIVLGAKRAGTTTLYHAVVAHPRATVLFPRWQRTKSPHYFDLKHTRPHAWYRSFFPLRRPVGPPRPLAGDAAPYLLYHPVSPRWVAEEAPRAKLLVMLRDPIERAWSHHWDRVRNGMEDLSFEDAVAAEPERLAGQEAALLADPTTPCPAHEHFSYVDRGRYAVQLRRWFAQVPAERMLIMRSEDFYVDPQRVFDSVTDFLGLSRFAPERFGRHHAHADRPAVPAPVRERLAPMFTDGNRDLADLLGTPVWWDAEGATPLEEPGIVRPASDLFPAGS